MVQYGRTLTNKKLDCFGQEQNEKHIILRTSDLSNKEMHSVGGIALEMS